MDRSGGGRRGGGKKGAKRPRPEACKLGVSPNFELAVKEIVKDWARSDDMAELEHQLFGIFTNFRTVKTLVARTLCSFREGLKHGGWMPLVNAAAVELGVDEGTVRRWVSNYERPIEIPGVVIDGAEKRSGPDAKSKTLEEFRGTVQGLLAGMPKEEAYAQAVEQEPLHQPPPPAVHPLTPMEQWISGYVEAGIRALAQVPENEKQDVMEGATAELMWVLTKCREPIMITPTEPTVDRSGRRRKPEHQSEPKSEAQTQIALSEVLAQSRIAPFERQDLALARVAFSQAEDQPLALSEAERAAFEQFVRSLESVWK
jgi:hypothetical protein